MATSSRSRAYRGTTVRLKIQYLDYEENPADPDGAPSIQITDPVGNVVVAKTTIGIQREDIGLYYYDYEIDQTDNEGLYEDYWEAVVNGVNLDNYFSFLVIDEGDIEGGNPPGEIKLGDHVDFDFSEEEIIGVNILLKYLKARLRSDGRKPMRDEFGAFIVDGYGNIQYEECNVFSDEILVTFLCSALSEFNMIPFFTSFTFADDVIRKLFSHAIVEGATVLALASQALVEKGRDFTISDGGISYQPPQLGDFLSSQYNNFLSSYRERLKFIKNNIRPGPQGFGTYTNLSSGAPAFARLRHLRARRVL
jgi:hypothetical protein